MNAYRSQAHLWVGLQGVLLLVGFRFTFSYEVHIAELFAVMCEMLADAIQESFSIWQAEY